MNQSASNHDPIAINKKTGDLPGQQPLPGFAWEQDCQPDSEYSDRKSRDKLMDELMAIEDRRFIDAVNKVTGTPKSKTNHFEELWRQSQPPKPEEE